MKEKKITKEKTYKKQFRIKEAQEKRLQQYVAKKGVKETNVMILALDYFLTANNF